MKNNLLNFSRLLGGIFYLSFFIFHLSFVYAQPPEAEKLFNRAAEKFLAKDYPGAISDLKKYLQTNPGDLHAVGLISRAEIAYAKELKSKGNLDEALKYTTEALKYSPDLKEAQAANADVKKAIKRRDAAKIEAQKIKAHSEKMKKAEEIARQKMQSEYAKKLAEEKRIREERERKMMEELARTKKESLARKEEIELLRQQTSMIATRWLIIFSIATLAIIAASYLIASKTVANITLRLRRGLAESNDSIAELVKDISKKSDSSPQFEELKKLNEQLLTQVSQSKSKPLEENLLKQTENLIKLVENMKSVSPSETETLEFEEPKMRAIITDVSTANRVRAKSVSAMANTVNNPTVAARLIAPFLNDKNNRVRATAAVEMFKFDPEAAQVAIKDMTQSDDKWTRLSAAWACGEIADLSVMNFLEILIEDFDPAVKARAVKAAKKAEEVLKARFPATLRVKLQRKSE